MWSCEVNQADTKHGLTQFHSLPPTLCSVLFNFHLSLSLSLSLSHGGESENECWKSEGNESVLLSLFQSLKIIDEYPTSQTIKRKISFHVQLSIIMILTLTIIFSQSGNKISTRNEFPVKPSRGCWVLTETKQVLVFMERLSALAELIAAELADNWCLPQTCSGQTETSWTGHLQ